ncbi:hypothetical protein PENARI_c003G08065 [Penicillium arizonense]|uniref:Major facilitator superfamily (MFS) profile domain-containing protein n=1 Tax=Penicillium arizonense TaxID=1835702 RepID=A0A1F5LTE3_PENAI|nr:hypothetical protein PENARI_c003G08065 [Penicillium arizonense]OGE56468.1 hypothetical protein PENARI_c003G08065 [Penicillium arizonense]
MSTQTQTETIVLQPTPHTEANTNENESTQDQSPPEVKWMYPKILSAGLSFFVAGVNDGSLGSILPYVIRSYDISTDMVAVLYGTTFFGWLVAALTNSTMTQYLDLGPILCLGAAIQILAHVLRVWLPPFGLFAVTFFLASLGQAYNDTHANTFVASLHGAHRYLGFIHAMYMAGCLVGPFVATGVASANVDSKWYLFYVFPLGVGIANLALVGASFRDRMASALTSSRRRERRERNASGGALKEIKETLSISGVWLLSWMVEYLVNVRDGDVKQMGYVPAGFYGGAFLGRLLLAEPTHRFGERRMIFIYAVLCLGLQLIFWLVPNIITEAVAVSLLGLFMGPFFATGISVGTKIFPPELQSSAIAFVFVFGQIGGSVFPALTGIIATRVGVQVLQPMLVGLIGASGLSWLILPKDAELHRD